MAEIEHKGFTPGPLEVCVYEHDWAVVKTDPEGRQIAITASEILKREDAQLYADAPNLLAQLKAAEAEIAELRKNDSQWMVMVDEVVGDWGIPEYKETDDGEAWYWCFPGHDLLVADNLSELLVAARQLEARNQALSEWQKAHPENK